MILETESVNYGFGNSENIVWNFDLTVWTSLSTYPLERWSATVQYIIIILCESQSDLKFALVKHEAWPNRIEIGIP